MIAKHGYRHHIATGTFISFCGLNNLFVRDYVEIVEDKIMKIGEDRQVFGEINELHVCKKCLSAIRHQFKIR